MCIRDRDNLAKKCHIDAAQLHDSINCYNRSVAAGKDKYNKATHFLSPIEKAPFYAIDVSLRNWRVPCFSITLGGLRVDEGTGAVLNLQGDPIDGLYAAGRNAVGVCSNSYISGLSLADCVFSGRRAGRSAALVSAAGST